MEKEEMSGHRGRRRQGGGEGEGWGAPCQALAKIYRSSDRSLEKKKGTMIGQREHRLYLYYL
jgi:hypothetical protein